VDLSFHLLNLPSLALIILLKSGEFGLQIFVLFVFGADLKFGGRQFCLQLKVLVLKFFFCSVMTAKLSVEASA
jgi:hypothetical protein